MNGRAPGPSRRRPRPPRPGAEESPDRSGRRWRHGAAGARRRATPATPWWPGSGRPLCRPSPRPSTGVHARRAARHSWRYPDRCRPRGASSHRSPEPVPRPRGPAGVAPARRLAARRRRPRRGDPARSKPIALAQHNDREAVARRRPWEGVPPRNAASGECRAVANARAFSPDSPAGPEEPLQAPSATVNPCRFCGQRLQPLPPREGQDFRQRAAGGRASRCQRTAAAKTHPGTAADSVRSHHDTRAGAYCGHGRRARPSSGTVISPRASPGPLSRAMVKACGCVELRQSAGSIA